MRVHLYLWKRNRAFSLLETMVVLFIVSVALALTIVNLSGYIAKQRLQDAVQVIETTLERSKVEASRTGNWVCIRLLKNKMQFFEDKNQDLVCGNPGDNALLSNIEFKDGVGFVESNKCKGQDLQGKTISQAGIGCVLWIDNENHPQLCPEISSTANCGASELPLANTPLSAKDCVPYSFQIIVSNENLPSGTRANEIEFVATGLVIRPNPNKMEKGNNESIWAKNAIDNDSSGSGACE